MGFFFIGVIGLLLIIWILDLRGRVSRLEHFVYSDKTRPQQSYAQGEEAVRPPMSAQHAPEQKAIHTAPTGTDKLTAWLKEDWLLKLGALLLLIGFGWLVTYAFLNNWIGPMGRIAMGIVAGACILLFGWWRIQKYRHQGSIFLVLGSTLILLTLFAAREVYDFFTPMSALFVMFLSTAFVALASVRYRVPSLALLSLLLAGVAPFLTNDAAQNEIVLFSYLFAVTLGAIWIVALTGQRELTFAALLLVALYSYIPFFSYPPAADKATLLLFIYAFAALFFITNTAGILRSKGSDIFADCVTAAGNGILLLAWIMAAAPEEWQSSIIVLWMIIFSAGAFFLGRVTRRHEPFYVYAGVGVAMLAAATAAELDGSALTIAYTVESGAIAMILYTLYKDLRLAQRAAALLIGPVLLSLPSMMSNAWRTEVLHKDFFVLFVLAVVLFVLGFFLFQKRKELPHEERDFSRIEAPHALMVSGSLYAFILLWLSLHAYFINDDTAVTIALFTYTITGLLLYFYGHARAQKFLYGYGALLLGFVVVRLLLVDVWDMALGERIVTFLGIGILLMSTAFFSRRASHKTR